MPVYYKNGDSWENVEAPYFKQDGEWVLPEQVYIKDGGKWRLVFEEFTFNVSTLSPDKSTRSFTFKGSLDQFEDDFSPKNAFFKEEELTDSVTVNAVSVDKQRKLIAIGGDDQKVYVYNQSKIIQPSGEISDIDKFTSPRVLGNVKDTIRSIDFYESEKELAVAADDLYIYDSDFKNVRTLSTAGDDGDYFTDVEFYEGGVLAAGLNGTFTYIFEKDDDGVWQRQNKLNDGINGEVSSVSFKQNSGRLAVGNIQGQVGIFDNVLTASTSTSQITDFDGNGAVDVAFEASGERLATLDFNERIRVYENSSLENDEAQYDFNKTEESEVGDDGAIVWDEQKNLAHASVDGNLYVLPISGSNVSAIKVFDDADKPYQDVAWDNRNQYLVGGTKEDGTGVGYAFSTGVQMFFQWGKVTNEGFEKFKKSTGTRSLGSFETEIVGLEPNKTYEYRAGGETVGGRIAVSKVPDEPENTVHKFKTPVIEFNSSAKTPTPKTTSATLRGEVSTFETQEGSSISADYIPAFQYKKSTREVFANEVELDPTGDSIISEEVTGLEPETGYDYRLKITYQGTVAYGDGGDPENPDFTTQRVKAAFDEGDSGVTFGSMSDATFTGGNIPDAQTKEKTVQMVQGSSTGGSYTVQDIQITGLDSTQFRIEDSYLDDDGNFDSPFEVPGDDDEFTVIFDPTTAGDGVTLKEADLEISHNAPFPEEADGSREDPISQKLTGYAEDPTELEFDADTLSFPTTQDGNEEENVVTVKERGLSYGASNIEVTEDSDQPSNTDTGEWRIEDRNNIDDTVGPDGSFDFSVFWNASEDEIQTYQVEITYNADGGWTGQKTLSGGITGEVDGEITVDVGGEGVTRNTGNSDPAIGDRFDPTITKEKDSNGSTIEDVTDVKEFIVLEDLDGNYRVQHMEITGTHSGDFQILNAPSDATDNSAATEVLIENDSSLNFDIEFNPSSTINAGTRTAELNVYAENVTNSHPVGESGNLFSLPLEAEALEPGEIVVENSSDIQVPEPVDAGVSIAGGNPIESEGGFPLTIRNKSTDIDVVLQSDSINNIFDEDFKVSSSIEGDVIGTSADAMDTETQAEVKFNPTVARAGDGGRGYSDGQKIDGYDADGDGTVENAYYKIFNDADFNVNPVNIRLEGEFQITDITYVDAASEDRDSSNEFDPSTDGTDIEIPATLNETATSDFTIYIPTGPNTVSTNAEIVDPDADPISLSSPKSGILDINGSKDSTPQDFLQAEIQYNPTEDSDYGVTQDIPVHWDNHTQSQTVTVKGVEGAGLDVSVKSGSSATGSNVDDYGDVVPNYEGLIVQMPDTTENTESNVTTVRAAEVGGNRAINITSDYGFETSDPNLSGNETANGQFILSNNNITDGTTLQGNEATADITFDPDDGEGGSDFGVYGEFQHDFDDPEETWKESPVLIAFEGTVDNKPILSMDDGNDGTAEYEALEEETDTSWYISIDENGNDNIATVEEIVISTDTQPPSFSLNDNDDDNLVDTGQPNNVAGGSFDISDSGTVSNNFVKFTAPDDPIGSDTTYEGDDGGEFKIFYSGEGIDGTNSTTVDLKGTALEPATIDVDSDIDFGTWEQGAGTVNTGGYTDPDPSEEFTIYETKGNEGFTIDNINVSTAAGNLFELNDPNNDGDNVPAGGSVTRAFKARGAYFSDGGKYTATATINVSTNSSNTTLQVQDDEITAEVKTVKASISATKKGQVGDPPGVAQVNYNINPEWNIYDFPVDANPQAEIDYNLDGGDGYEDYSLIGSAGGEIIQKTYTADNTSKTVRFKIYESSDQNTEIAYAEFTFDLPENPNEFE